MSAHAQVDSVKKSLPHQVKADTLSSVADSTNETRPSQRNPKQAALMSLVVPGLGQAYNKRYWKIPIVYAALGTAGYFFVSNRVQYNKYKDAYVQDSQEGATEFSEYTNLGWTLTDIQGAAEQHLTWSEYAGVAIFAAYALQIIDATVDAHLFYFDVSDDLSLHVQPTIQLTPSMATSNGLSIALTF